MKFNRDKYLNLNNQEAPTYLSGGSMSPLELFKTPKIFYSKHRTGVLQNTENTLFKTILIKNFLIRGYNFG